MQGGLSGGGGSVLKGAGGPGGLSLLLQELARALGNDVHRAWQQRLQPGEVVGRFEILREIGRGGFGVVYEAIAADNISRARTALGRAQDLTPHCGVPILDLATGLLLARVGRHGDALERADALKAFGERAHIPWLVMFGHLLAGSVLLPCGRNDAQVELAAAREVARENGSVLADYVAGMVEAAAEVRAADTAGAAESLPGPMALGRQRRFAPHLWLTPGEIAALCHVARRHCIEPEYCQWLEAKR